MNVVCSIPGLYTRTDENPYIQCTEIDYSKSYQQNLIRIHLLFEGGDDAFLSLTFICVESRTLLISVLVEVQ